MFDASLQSRRFEARRGLGEARRGQGKPQDLKVMEIAANPKKNIDETKLEASLNASLEQIRTKHIRTGVEALRASRPWKLEQNNMTKKGPVLDLKT